MKKHAKHHGKGTKSVKHSMHGGGNLHLGSPSSSIHVAHKGDSMAKNVSDHMRAGNDMGPKQPVAKSGGKV